MLSSSKKLKTIKPQEQEGEGEDILSNLPRPILHQILSFLPDIKYTILTSTLSKTWNSISNTSPFLAFNFETYGGITKTRQPYQSECFTQFLEFVNKVLTSHYSHSHSYIQRFSLQCGNEYVIPSSTLKKWIEIVARRGVQDLSIEFLSEQFVLDLPREFFSCRSLVNFKLMVLNFDVLEPVRPLFNLPESGPSFVKLRTLHLQLVCFDGGFMQKLFSSCPVLHTLVMRDCGVHEVDNLVISGNQLKYLEIDEFYAYVGQQRKKSKCKITISAPNVESFVFKGDLMNDFYIENLASLVEGDIDIELPFAGPQVCGKMIETRKKKYDMMKFFGGLSNARSLTLCAWSLEVIGVGSGITSTLFSGLRQLKLKTCLANNCIPGIKYLLENSCNLETLVMQMTWEPCSQHHHMNASYLELLAEFDTLDVPIDIFLDVLDSWADNWETEVVPVTDPLLECNFSHLKFVEVWTTLGSGHDLDFIRILLKNAMALEKLTIINSKGHPLCSEGQLMEFSTSVLAFQRASSNVEIVFFQA